MAIGYADLDHVVAPVASLAAGTAALEALGLVAAPVQEALGERGETHPIAGLRHFVFAPAAGRADLANMVVLLELAPGRPGPPGPVAVCAAADLEPVHGAMVRAGIAAGAVTDVEPRVWRDPGSGAEFAVRARRLAMSPDAPIVLNGSQAGDLRGYHHAPWQAHPGGVIRLAGVTFAGGDPSADAAWLAATVFAGEARPEGGGGWLVWPRDLFVRVEPAGERPAGALTAVTLLVGDAGAFADAPRGWARVAAPARAGITLRSADLPLDLTLVDEALLASLPGAPGS